jgi:uncharacterized protein YnzC (UPF0291/DUF896 family)
MYAFFCYEIKIDGIKRTRTKLVRDRIYISYFRQKVREELHNIQIVDHIQLIFFSKI